MDDLTEIQLTEVANTKVKILEREVQRLNDVNQDQLTLAVTGALRTVFGENVDSKRFVDITRIPLICQSIIEIHGDIKDIKESLDKKFVTKEEFSPIQKIVMGAVGMILVAVLGALIALVIKK